MSALLPGLPLALLLLLLVLVAPRTSSSIYHTSSEVLDWYKEHAERSHDRLRFDEVVEPKASRILHAATISDFRSIGEKKNVLLVFSEHAREVITSEVALWLSQLLVYESSAISVWPELLAALNNGTTPSSTNDEARRVREWVQEFRQRFSITIVPLANLNGRLEFERGLLCLRKTPTGVDLNRNWPLFWQAVSQSDESHGGSHPLSEAESRLLKQLAERARPYCYINVHSGEWAVYSPWDSKRSMPPDLPAGMGKLIRRLGEVCGCKAGPAGAVSGYLAFGTSMDYMYSVQKVPYTLTMEVFGRGNEGKLKPGDSNQDMSSFPAEQVDATIAQRSMMRRRRILQRVQQQDASMQMEQQHGRRQQQHAGGRIDRAAAHLDSADTEAAASTFGAAVAGARAGKLEHRQLLVAKGSANDSIMAVYHQANHREKNCFELFNPVTEAEYREVVGKWVAAVLITLRHLADTT